jgi:O-antigen/teichoic acid export membrane protein
MSIVLRAKSFLAPKLRHVGAFFMNQGIIQAANTLYGIACVRMLPIPDYAKYTLVYGYLGTLTVFLDGGMANTINPIIGARIGDLQLIADVVASLRTIVMRAYLMLIPFAAAAFVYLARRQEWSVPWGIELGAVLLVSLWFARVSSAYGQVLLIRRDRTLYYRYQMAGYVGSLVLLGLSVWLHVFSVLLAILLNLGQLILIATLNYRRARSLLGVAGRSTKAIRGTILRLALPNMPATMFYAVQGQITLLLLVLMGHSTTSVANIGALNRLAQIPLFLSVMNPILVEPFFAKLAPEKLKRTYLFSVVLVASLAVAMATFVFYFPESISWLLGPKYSHLRLEIGMIFAAACIFYVSGFMFFVNSSRRFVYWWTSAANITSTILIETYFIWKVDLSSVRHLLAMGICNSTGTLLVTAACSLYGLKYGPKKIELHGSVPEELSGGQA